MTLPYDRDWVHPFCHVRPMKGVKLVQDYVDQKRTTWELLCRERFDLGSIWLRRWMAAHHIRIDHLRNAADDLVNADQTPDDACWDTTKTGYIRRRRQMAWDMGLFPAFTDRNTPEYDEDADIEFDGKLLVACRWGTKKCCRPSHLVVGIFAGRNPDKRLQKADREAGRL